MRRSSSARAVALFAAALFSIGQLGAVAHEEAEHTICPEHGESIHVEASSSHEAAPGWSARTEAESHAEHCGALFSLQSGDDTTRHVASVAPVTEARCFGPAVDANPSIAVLTLAPKASPPVLA